MKNKKIEDILKEFDRAFNEIPYRSGMLVDVQADDVKAFISVSLQSIYEQGKKDARKQLLDEIMEEIKVKTTYEKIAGGGEYSAGYNDAIEIIKSKYNL